MLHNSFRLLWKNAAKLNCFQSFIYSFIFLFFLSVNKIQSGWTKKGQSYPSQQPELPSERHDSSGRTCARQVCPARLSLLPQILPSLRVTQTQRLMLRSELRAGRPVASRTPCSSFMLQTALNHRLAGSPGLLSPPHVKTVWLYSVSFPLRYSWGTDI